MKKNFWKGVLLFGGLFFNIQLSKKAFSSRLSADCFNDAQPKALSSKGKVLKVKKFAILDNSVFQLLLEKNFDASSLKNPPNYLGYKKKVFSNCCNNDKIFRPFMLSKSYSEISVSLSNQAIKDLKNPKVQQKQSLRMMGKLGHYNPPALMALAVYLKKTHHPLAQKIYWLARTRSIIDTLYCQQMDDSVEKTPGQLIKWYYDASFFKLKNNDILCQARDHEKFLHKHFHDFLRFDKEIPRHYDVRWPLLNGQKAFCHSYEKNAIHQKSSLKSYEDVCNNTRKSMEDEYKKLKAMVSNA